MAYRLELLARHLRHDAEAGKVCVTLLRAVLQEAPYSCVAALALALDDVELWLVRSLLGRDSHDAGVLASFGRGLFRVGLLEQLVRREYGDAVDFDKVMTYRMLLAARLQLPGESRGILRDGWQRFHPTPAQLDRMCRQVLCTEAEHGFDGLDRFISEWGPWQQYVRFRHAPEVQQINLDLQTRLEEAERRLSCGELAPAAFHAFAASLPASFDAAFRQCCRDIHRRCRTAPGSDVAAGAQLPQVPAVALNPAVPTA